MLLIRPLLQTNRERKHVAHTVVFFIFLVSNIGGCLTPLGDPPLFLGYLQGVPFLWTLRLLVPWLFTVGAGARGLRGLGPSAPTRARSAQDLRRDFYEVRPLRARRASATSRCSAACCWRSPSCSAPWRELAIVALAVGSLAFDRPRACARPTASRFHPILEVAALFAGIFVTMLPALDLLRGAGRRARRARALAVLLGDRGAVVLPRQRADLPDVPGARRRASASPPQVVGVPARDPRRRSASARCSWARTRYIGNGPNFMVRSIAEERGVRMPSFGGYMLYSAGGARVPRVPRS